MEEPTIQIGSGMKLEVSLTTPDTTYYVANDDGTLRKIEEPPADLDYCAIRSEIPVLQMAKRATEPSTGGASDIKLVEQDLLEGAKELAEEQNKGAGYIFYVPPGCSTDFVKDIQSLLADHASVLYRYTPWIIPRVE